MTPHRGWFSEYDRYDGGEVLLGDDSPLKIIGRGRIKILLQDGRVKTLPGVMHIPGLARNLISISKMADAGVNVNFSKDSCNMVHGSMVLARGV